MFLLLNCPKPVSVFAPLCACCILGGSDTLGEMFKDNLAILCPEPSLDKLVFLWSYFSCLYLADCAFQRSACSRGCSVRVLFILFLWGRVPRSVCLPLVSRGHRYQLEPVCGGIDQQGQRELWDASIIH